MSKQFTIGEFSKITNVTSRTLQYYDEIGLLCASRKKSGHRFYIENDIITLQKIVALKFLGYSLQKIKNLLQKDRWDTLEYFSFQRQEMIKKRDQLNHAIRMLDHAHNMIDETGKLDSDIFISLINSIQMKDEHKEWLQTHFPASLIERLYQHSEETQLETEKRFIAIMGELKNGNLSNPRDEKTQELIGKLFKLLEETIGDDLPYLLTLTEEFDFSDGAKEQWLFPSLPLSQGEEEILAKAFEIFLENGGEMIDQKNKK